MDVGLSHDNVDALTRHDQLSRNAHLRGIRVALDAADADAARVRGAGGGCPAGACPADHDGWPHTELARCVQEAEKGRGDAARRVAELLELLDRPKDAAVWWHRAAVSGDRDAKWYVAALELPDSLTGSA
ncbi:hypothetical protein [Amycolatopsis sp. WGS_07]|uniref:hypothetical protein n=1 Tax=Amycolatopsis sp. WGS_07 TaxID=3076764 RepID=UPI003873562D